MSRQAAALPTVEWSPTGIWTFDPADRRITSYDGLAAASMAFGRTIEVAPSRRLAFIRSIRVPNVSDEEVRQILGIQIGQHFPVGAEELAYDFISTQDVNFEGKLIVVAAIKTETRKEIDAAAQAAGLRVSRVVPVAFGAQLVAKEAGLENCAVVSDTSEGLAIDIIVDGVLRYSRVVPMPDSEPAIEGEIRRTFQAAGVAPSPVLGVGKFGSLPGATKAETSPLAALSLAGPTAVPIELVLPEARRKAEELQVSRRQRLALAAIAVAVLMGAFLWLERSDQVTQARQVESNWNSKIRAAQTKLNDAEKLRDGVDVVNASLTRAFTPSQPMSDVLSVATNLAPTGVWLTGFNLERGKPLTIRGAAMNNPAVASYVDMLANSGRFRDVRLIFANEAQIEGIPVVQYSIQAHVIGNFPMVEQNQRRTTTTAARTTTARANR